MIEIKIIEVDTIPEDAMMIYYPAPVYLAMKGKELIGYSLKSDMDEAVENMICIRNAGHGQIHQHNK